MNERDSGNPIRNFFKGFKPTWKDIIDKVPAELENTRIIYEEIYSLLKIKSIQTSIFTVFLVPPAQENHFSKTNCLKISEHNTPVYYVENINANLKDLMN